MTTRIVLIISALFFGFTTGFTAHAMELNVETENGKKLIIKDMKYGHLKQLSKGERVKTGEDSQGNPIYRFKGAKIKFIETNDIPLKVGEGFGLKYRLPEITMNDEIVLVYIYKLPKAVTNGGKASDTVKSKSKYGSGYSGKVRYGIWKFRKANPEYHIAGKWTISLYNKERLLVSHSFNVME